MDINIAYLPFFALGIIFQVIAKLSKKWKSSDWVLIAAAIVLGSFSGIILGGDAKRDYILSHHLTASLLFSALLMVLLFRKRFISFVSARSLIVLNIIALFLVLDRYNLSREMMIVLAVPSLLTLIGGFSNIDRHFGFQVFFYVWFLVLSVAITVIHFFSRELFLQFDAYDPGKWSIFLDAFLVGSALFYLMINAFYVINLLPTKGKLQSWSSRFEDIREHMQLLAYGYIWKKGDLFGNLVTLVILPAILILNMFYGFIDKRSLITVIIATIPFLDRRHPIDGDGIGDFPDA